MPTKGTLNLSPKDAWNNFTDPGIELKTPNEIKVYAASKMEVIMGAKTSMIAGNYFSTNLGVTNKIYAMEYGQWYPGYKIDVDGISKKWSFINAHFAARKQNTYLNQLEAIQSHYKLAVQQLESCQSRVTQARCNFDFNDFQASKRKLETAKADVTLFEEYVAIKKAEAVSEQKKIISKVSESKIERARAAVIGNDVQMINNKLTII